MGFILILLGLLNLISPQAGWYLNYGWRFKDAEPSDAALLWGRISGAIFVLVGFAMLGGCQ